MNHNDLDHLAVNILELWKHKSSVAKGGNTEKGAYRTFPQM